MASEIRVNRLSNRSGLSTITFANGGVQFSGITTFANGDFRVGTGATILNPSANEMQFHTGGSSRLTINNSGANLGTGNITAVDATFTGNVSIGKTLTYEDVKNVDSVGVVTARTGVKITGGDFTVGTAITASSVTGNVTQDVGITTFSGSAVWFKGATANKDMYWSHSSGATVYKDNAQILMGDSSDLQISHDGSNSLIKDTGTGFLSVQGSEVHIRGSNDENGIKVITNDRVEIYHDDSKKFETTSSGISITGNISLPSGNLYVSDSQKVMLGTSDDLQMYHNGTENRVWATNGPLDLRTTTSANVEILANDKYSFWGEADGMAALYHNGTRKFETASYGAQVKGNLVVGTDAGELLFSNPDGYSPKFKENAGALETWTNNTLRFSTALNGNTVYSDDVKIFFGTGSDFRFWHDGSTNNIWGTGAHDLKIATNNTERLRIKSGGEVRIGANSTTASTAGDDLVIEGSSDRGLSIITGTSSSANIYFGDTDDANIGRIAYQHNDNALDFAVNAAGTKLRISSTGQLLVGTTSSSDQFHFLKSHNSHTRLVVQNNWGGNATAQLKLISPTDEFQLVKYASGDAHIALSNSANIKFYIGGTERMRIDSNGYTHQDQMPVFHAQSSPSRDSSGFVHSFGSVRSNIGSHYNNGSGKFTAPVNGFYFFSFSVWCNDGNVNDGTGSLAVVTIRNSSDTYQRDAAAFNVMPGNSASSSLSASGSGVVYMAANDHARLSTQFSLRGSQPRNMFSGFLVHAT